MAWNPSPKVADCREIARKWNKQIVIILAVNTRDKTLESASYGETRELCQIAKILSDKAYDMIIACPVCEDNVRQFKAMNEKPGS